MVGTWQRLAHVELSSAGTTLDSGTFTAKKNLKVIIYDSNSGAYRNKINFNSDSGSNYSMRYSRSGATGATETSQSKLKMGDWSWNGASYHVLNITNISDKEKLVISETTKGQSGASNAPNRTELVGKWVNTSAQITSIQITSENSGGAQNIGAGSYITVFGASGDVVTDEKQTLAEGTRTENATVTYSNDFSSDNMADQDSSKIGISSNVLNYTIGLDNSNDASSWDLGATLSDTAWVCRFKMTVSSLTQSDGTFVRGAFGLSSLPSSSNSQQSHDFIGLQTRVSNVYEERRYLDADGGAIDGDGDGTIAYGLAANQTTYVEIIRTGSTSYTIQLFSDSDYSTSLANKVTGTCGSLTGLRYFGVWNDSSGTSSNQISGTIDDVKIYNGVTSFVTTVSTAPNAGTRYEETDTRKIYRKVTPTQASYTNDFSSSTGWTLGSGHTISGNKLSGTFTSGGDRSYLDLSSVNISDDSWVLRFGLKITATNTSSVNVLSMGLADSTAVGSAVFGAGDDFNAIIYTSDNQKYNMRATNGGSSVFYERSTSTPVTNTQYYVELKKISDTSASLRFYDNSNYTAGSNALELLTNTSDTSGLTNLDYFMIKPYDTSSGSHTIEISDLKIYNGVSEVDTNEWKERGTA